MKEAEKEKTQIMKQQKINEKKKNDFSVNVQKKLIKVPRN